MELRKYVRIFRKRWRLVVVCPLIASLVAAIVVIRSTPQYQSTVRFFISTPASAGEVGVAYTGGLFSQQRVKSYQDLVAGPRVASAVLTEVGPDGGLGSIAAVGHPDTVLLSATVTHPSPARARAIAAALGRVFPRFVDTLETPDGGGAATIRAIVVADPVLPEKPVSPRPLRTILLAICVGSMAGVALALGREALDTTIKTPEDVRELSGLATLGAISFDARAARRPLVVHDDPHSPRAEAFRQLRTNLQFVSVDRPLRSIVFTSPLPGEGKSTSACNLAITLAQAGIRVLLVEADLRRPKTSEYLGLESAVGLTSVLIGKVSLDDALQNWGEDGLTVLASGPLPPNPSELLASDGMHDLIDELERRFTVVIIDAPPLLPVTDAAVLATLTSGAVLCLRASRVRRDQAVRAVESLHAVDAEVLGAVLTMVPRRGPDAYYSYAYGVKPRRAERPRKIFARDDARAASGTQEHRGDPAKEPAV